MFIFCFIKGIRALDFLFNILFIRIFSVSIFIFSLSSTSSKSKIEWEETSRIILINSIRFSIRIPCGILSSLEISRGLWFSFLLSLSKYTISTPRSKTSLNSVKLTGVIEHPRQATKKFACFLSTLIRSSNSPCYFVFSFFHSVCKKKKRGQGFLSFFLRSASLKGIFFNGCERDRDNEKKGRNIWFTVARLRYGNETFVIFRL